MNAASSANPPSRERATASSSPIAISAPQCAATMASSASRSGVPVATSARPRTCRWRASSQQRRRFGDRSEALRTVDARRPSACGRRPVMRLREPHLRRLPKRASTCGTGRTSPARPSSPNATDPRGQARRPGAPRRARARAGGRRRARRPSRRPRPRRTRPGRRSGARRAARARRGPAARAAARRRWRGGAASAGSSGVTSACTSTSSGREPSTVAMTTEPGTPAGARRAAPRRASRRRRARPRPSRRRRSRSRSRSGSSPRARSRNAWSRSPSKYSTVSTMCSSTRGPAMAPSFVT